MFIFVAHFYWAVLLLLLLLSHNSSLQSLDMSFIRYVLCKYFFSVSYWAPYSFALFVSCEAYYSINCIIEDLKKKPICIS